MIYKFKVGDYIKCTSNLTNQDLIKGQIYTVSYRSHDIRGFLRLNDNTLIAFSDNFVLASKKERVQHIRAEIKRSQRKQLTKDLISALDNYSSPKSPIITLLSTKFQALAKLGLRNP